MSQPPARDPRNRPIRVAVLGAYLVFSVGFSGLVTANVISSVARQQPAHVPPDAQPIPVAACLVEARALAAKLDAQRQGLTALPERTSADKAWNTFRTSWLTELRALEGRCGNGLADRRELGPMFDELENLLDRYTTHTVQFAGQLGPALDAFDAAVKKAAQ